MGSISSHITPRGGGQPHTNTHTDVCGQSNSKKPGTRWPVAGAVGLKINHWNLGIKAIF